MVRQRAWQKQKQKTAPWHAQKVQFPNRTSATNTTQRVRGGTHLLDSRALLIRFLRMPSPSGFFSTSSAPCAIMASAVSVSSSEVITITGIDDHCR